MTMKKEKLKCPLCGQAYATVVSTDINNGKIYTDKGYCYLPGVIKWPWELKQKEEGDKQ